MTTVQPPLFGVAQTHATKDDHYTPSWVFEAMGITFDLDVCAPPSGIPWVPADRFYTVEDDGLTAPWSGRVWMNPPYSNCTPWVDKFINHAHGVCLVPHAKSLWHSRLWDAADGIAQPPKRVIFIGADGDVSLPTFFAAFGDECVGAISRLGVVRCKPPDDPDDRPGRPHPRRQRRRRRRHPGRGRPAAARRRPVGAREAEVSLETRGVRPNPHHRSKLARFFYHRLDRHERLLRPYIVHEMLWGVPCGPTLTMVKPARLVGIQVDPFRRVDRAPLRTAARSMPLTSERVRFALAHKIPAAVTGD